MPPFPERESSLLAKLRKTAPKAAKIHEKALPPVDTVQEAPSSPAKEPLPAIINEVSHVTCYVLLYGHLYYIVKLHILYLWLCCVDGMIRHFNYFTVSFVCTYICVYNVHMVPYRDMFCWVKVAYYAVLN